MSIPVETMTLWARVLVARFGKPYNFDPVTWEQVYREDLGRNWSADEIIETLKWMNGPGQKRSAPTGAVDIVIAVRTRRKQLDPSRAPVVDGVQCADCRGTGWVRYWPTCRADLSDQTPGAVDASIPCLCALGCAETNRPTGPYAAYSPEQSGALAAHRALAHDQRRAVRAMEQSDETPATAIDPSIREILKRYEAGRVDLAARRPAHVAARRAAGLGGDANDWREPGMEG